jgi:plastocyanin
MRRALGNVAFIAITFVASACAQPVSSAPSLLVAVPAVQSWKIGVGAQSDDMSVQIPRFFPAELTVNAGDNITWTNDTAETHTVTFLASGQPRPRYDRTDPLQAEYQGNGQLESSSYLNSGLLEAGKSFSLTAYEPGVYSYFCLVHSSQTGSVVVQPSGTRPIGSMSRYEESVRTAPPLISEWKANLASFEPVSWQREEGGKAYLISGGMGADGAAVMRFSPQTLDVQVGDTVTWRNSDEETPHTVTFGRIQAAATQPFGDPSAFDGTPSLNSGYIGQNRPLGTDFSVTFTAPGQYRYDCALHVGEGMSGVIRVKG